MRIAALDIGTNTVLLLIVERRGQTIRVLRDDHAIARLGEGVDKTRHISEAAYARFRSVLEQHVATIRDSKVDRIAAVGTSALRDAENRDDIIRRTKADTGIEIELLSGNDEARWSYVGALFGMENVQNATVIDIGGGSTELSFGDGRTFAEGRSLDIGAVRLTERFFHASPIALEEAEAAREFVRQELTHAPSVKKWSGSPSGPLIAVAGTPTTLAAMHQHLALFDAAKVQGYVLQKLAVQELLDRLLKTDTRTVLQNFPAVNKARADILPAGTLILREAMEFLGATEVRVSAHGLRYGIALREAPKIGTLQ